MSSIGTPLVVGILLIGVVSNFTMIYDTTRASDSLKQKSESKKYSREMDRLNSRFKIQNVTLLNFGTQINMTVLNTGSITFSQINEFILLSNVINSSIILNNTINCNWSYFLNPTILNPLFWDPGETLNINITLNFSLSAGNYYILVCSPSGIKDTYQWYYSG